MHIIHCLTLLLALGASGCAGYRLGPTHGQTAGARSIQITPFVNHTPEPGLADDVTYALRKAIQRDGTYRLETHGEPDLIVTGVITEYRRRELSLLREDLRTVRDYQVALTASVTVRERATGRVVLDRSLSGGTLVRIGSGFVSSERQAAPLLANDLARQITDLLVDGDW
jgi:hypothetical protein